MDRFTSSAVSLLVGVCLIVLGVAGVASSAAAVVFAGAALVLAPLVASVAIGGRRRGPAC
jgi:hypothetical protein